MLTYITIFKFYTLIISTQLLLWPCATFVEGTKCPGQCISPKKCKEKGGKILAYCTNTKACCGEPRKVYDVCNQNKWNARTAFFKSPNYPEPYVGSLVCQFRLNLFPTTIGVRLDFLDLSLPSRPGTDEEHVRGRHGALGCDSDMFFIRGFSDWMPDPKCGNLTGQSTVLELEEKQQQISLLFVMSSDEYKWNIKLTQISSRDTQRTELCWKKKMEMWNKEIGVEYQYNNDPVIISNDTLTDNSTMKLTDVLTDGTNNNDYNGYPGDFIGPLPLIENGETSRLEEIPWQVSIQKKVAKIPITTIKGNSTRKKCPIYTNGGTRHNCGGSIIGERHILTASHCVLNADILPMVYQSENLKIHVGDYDFCRLNETSNFEIHEVEKIIFHFNYIASAISNDIAVIILKKKIKFGKTVRPITLASLNLEDIEYDNSTNLLFSGWGNMQKISLTNAAPRVKYPTIMRKTTKLTVNDLDDCNEPRYYDLTGIENGTAEEALEFLSNKYSDSFQNWICTTGDEDGNPSFGDSGGPLVALDENWKNPYLIGVVSYVTELLANKVTKDGKRAPNRRASLFTKVTSYLDWIYMALHEEC